MLINVARGLDLALEGEPRQAVDDTAPVGTVALLGLDYAQLKPVLAIDTGQAVRSGQVLFSDRAHPAVRYTAPASGRISAIHRGRKRRLLAVVIEVDERGAADTICEPFDPSELATLDPELVRARLLDSGLWTALRGRPFDAVARPDIRPRAIFVTAMDSAPLAADPNVVIARDHAAFAQGLTILARLGDAVLVCSRPSLSLPEVLGAGLERVAFTGPHPAGLPGTHMDALAEVGDEPDLWHVGYQDVMAIGRLFVTGRLSMERIVALGGPGAKRPRLLCTRLGANLSELLADELEPGSQVISGSVLDGRKVAAPSDFLGRYDTQISVFREAPESEAAATGPSRRGRAGGMLALERFERVWPFAAPPLPLLRALLAGDTELARRLGCLGLSRADLALCSYVCPAKNDYGAALSRTLEELHAEL